jgi:glutamate racemase
VLQRMLGPRVTTIASGRPVARQVEHVLGVRGLANPRSERPGPPAPGEYRFLCTGDVDGFRALGTRFLQMPLGEVTRVELGARAVARVVA